MRDLICGAVELEETDRGLLPHRLPAWARAQTTDPQLHLVEAQPAGVRLALRTTATTLDLDVLPTKRAYAGMPPRPDGVYDVVVDGELTTQLTAGGGDVLHLDLATGTSTLERGEPTTLRIELREGEKDVEVWLPHDERTELVALRADAPTAQVETTRKRWVHHGSSISHGSNATHPTGTWPVVAARATGLDLLNLGLGGSALLDPFVARVIRDTPADLISLKLGINLVNTDLVRRRALGPAVHGFLDTIRDGHPDTPITLISPIFCGIHETTPGPSAPDLAAYAEGRLAFVATGDPGDPTRLTLEVVREELAAVAAQRGDVRYVDGRELYGEADAAELPLPDGLHPDAAAHRRIGERFARLLG